MREMNLLSLMLVLAATSGCATAGSERNPCGLVQRANDPFVGETEGFVLYLDKGQYTAVGLREVKGVYTLTVLMVQRGDSLNVGSVGDRGEFIVDGEVMALELSKEAKPIANVKPGAGVFSQWVLEYGVSREQATRLASASMSALKVIVGSETFQMPIEATNRVRIQNSVRCMTK